MGSNTENPAHFWQPKLQLYSSHTKLFGIVVLPWATAQQPCKAHCYSSASLCNYIGSHTITNSLFDKVDYNHKGQGSTNHVMETRTMP